MEAGEGLPEEYLNSQMTVLEAPTAMRGPTNCWQNFRCLAFLVILALVFAAIWLVLVCRTASYRADPWCFCAAGSHYLWRCDVP